MSGKEDAVEYVREQRRSGASDNVIETVLMNMGLSRGEAGSVMEEAGIPPPPAPAARPETGPAARPGRSRAAVVAVVVAAVLAVAAGAIFLYARRRFSARNTPVAGQNVAGNAAGSGK